MELPEQRVLLLRAIVRPGPRAYLSKVKPLRLPQATLRLDWWVPRADMNMPQKADKWIVFALLLVLSIVDAIRLRAPWEPSVIAFIVVSLLPPTLLTVFFLIWRAACRLITRLLLKAPTPGNVRIFANVSFLLIVLALIALMYVPVFTATGTVDFVVKMPSQAPAPPRQPH